MPTKGNVRTLTLLIDFADYRSSVSRDYIHERLYGNGDPARFPNESLARFYERSSYGQLFLYHGTTLGWYHAPYNRSEIPQTTQGREALIKEAINYFDSQGHDFSQYDNDANGEVDYLIVIWTGPDTGWSTFWWAQQPNFNDANFMVDGKRVWTYSWNFLLHPDSTVGTFDPLTIIHETGHALGLPDYYDYDTDMGPAGGVGNLDMMDGNWGDHNAFSKWVLDWITPTIVAGGSQTITLSPSGSSKDAVLIMPELTGTTPFGEFFMAQNRYRTGNDQLSAEVHDRGPLPGDGMLIWHVDARLNNAEMDYLNNNSHTEQKLLRLMEADGSEDIERSSYSVADAGDYYKVGKEFTPQSLPSSAAYGGDYTGVNVTGISSSGNQVTGTFSVHPRARLAVSKSGDGAGVLTSSTPGIDCGADCTASYPIGSSVTVTARPGPLSAFTGWSGACSGTGDCTVTLNGDSSVTAGFSIRGGGTRPLMENPGFELGKLPWSESSYLQPRPLIRQEPQGGSNLSDWYAALGGVNGADDEISQLVTIPKEATRVSLRFRYQVIPQQPGRQEDSDRLVVVGSLNSQEPIATLTRDDITTGWTQSRSYDVSYLRGTPRFYFIGVNDHENPTTFKIDDVELEMTIQDQPQRTLTVSLAGDGGGSVNSVHSEFPFSCSMGTCSRDLREGGWMRLTASLPYNAYFLGWSGDCRGSGDCLLTMSTDRNVTATFKAIEVSRTGGVHFDSIQRGYDAAVDGGTVEIYNMWIPDNLVADRDVSVKLRGGYDFSSGAITGFTVLDGRLNISRGTLRVEGLKILGYE